MILDEGERGALRIAKLSTELAEVTAEVVRCRGEVIVARRLAELAKLRRDVAEVPDQVDGRLERFRACARKIAAADRQGSPKSNGGSNGANGSASPTAARSKNGRGRIARALHLGSGHTA